MSKLAEKTAEITKEQADATIAHLQNQVRWKQFKNYLVNGATIGIGVGGLGMLGKALINPSRSVNTSYTEPVDTVVYRPDREKGRKKKESGFDLTAPIDAAEKMVSEGDWAEYAVPTAAAAVGIPLGYLGVRALSKKLQDVTRRQELREAQREFEMALQQYAEAGDEKRKFQAAKQGSLTAEEALMNRLAANCVKLAEIQKTARDPFSEIIKSYAGYSIPAALVGGYFGFNNKWKNRKQKDLDTAERQVNLMRESSNPTFSTARLEDPVDLDPPKKSRKKRSAEEKQRAEKELNSSRNAELEQAVAAALERMPVSYL